MTIAQQLKIKEFPFEIRDSNGNRIYFENSDGSWYKREYDSNGNLIYHENSEGYWMKREYDSEDDLIYFEDLTGVKIIKKCPKTEVDEKTTTNGWVSVTEALPKPLQTVWLTNGKGWACLGCRVENNEGWHWAESNGIIYVENGEIVSECESEDLDVKFWHELPKLPYL